MQKVEKDKKEKGTNDVGFVNGDKNGNWQRAGLILFVKLSGWIGFPVITALFIGKWLDEKYQTEPWLFLISVGVAFIVSLVGIVKESYSSMAKIEEIANKREN